MTQEHINFILSVLVVVMPFAQFFIGKFVDKYFTRAKDKGDYSDHLLEIANDATLALQKARDEISSMEVSHDKILVALRAEYDDKIDRLRNRISELETITRVYRIQFDLVTHPNMEIKNQKVESVDYMTNTQKLKAIQSEKSDK